MSDGLMKQLFLLAEIRAAVGDPLSRLTGPELVARVKAIVALACERCFHTAGRESFDRQGFSAVVEEESAIRDINYRDAPLHPTAMEAVLAALDDASAAGEAKPCGPCRGRGWLGLSTPEPIKCYYCGGKGGG